MKVLVVGAGVMSDFLIKSILETNNEFIGRVDFFGNGEFSSFEEVDKDFDIIIDFSNHKITEKLLEFAVTKKKNILIATTGHDEKELESIKIASNKIAILKSTNTSFGVNVLNKIVAYATKLLKDFDVEIIEKHHIRKIDAPSGTANTLIDIIEKNKEEDLEKSYGRYNKKRKENEIGVHSIRAGNIVGEHSVIYSKNDEIIEIKHEAISRKIFSDGAIKLAIKLIEKEVGYFENLD